MKEMENVVVATTTQQVANGNSNRVYNGNRKPAKVKGQLPPVTQSYPEHIVNLAAIVKNNAEIRRFTALGILNYLMQKGVINGVKRYVVFKWNKFGVYCDGLMREYLYTEPFFINALIASFTSFSANAQKTINDFCKKEMSVTIDKAANQQDIDDIVEMNAKQKFDNAESDVVAE